MNRYALGSYHQRDSRFGSTARMRGSCILLFAICWSITKKVSV